MTASNFPACLDFTLAHEGGFVDMREDRGGATNMGITADTLADWLGRAVAPQDVQGLTRETARAIYQTEYWQPVNGNALPPGLDLMVFDFAVNVGPQTSAKHLQGLFKGLRQDGIIGNLTLTAIRMHALDWIIATLGLSQQAYYNDIVQASPTQSVFLAGWLARCSDRTAAAKTMALSDG